MKSTRSVIVLSFAIVASFSACKKNGPKEDAQQEASKAEAQPPLEVARKNTGAFQPLPDDWAKEGQTKAQENLGRMLYYESRMSKNHDISCNSCHKLDQFGVDALPTSPGHKKALGSRNSPTVYNAAGHFTQFWDGRADDVEEQAKGPVLNPIEMAMPDEATVVTVLKSIPGYTEAFKNAFPDADDPITYDNVAVAIGAFERRLSTPSRWDRFLKGNDKALTQEEVKGFNIFVNNGCVACHNGALVGGASFQKVGAVKPWPNQTDHGRFDVTKDDGDDMVFKAPSLRNIAKTGPYFHDGTVDDLAEAVKVMGEHQLGKTLTDEEAKLIVAWLETLTGEIDQAYIAKPELPESGPTTPNPDPT